MGESARRTTMSHRGTPGFTLVEVTIILLVLTTLSTIMLPQMGNFNRLARFTKAREDLGALCAVAKTMLDSVWLSTFYDDPAGDSWTQNPAFPVGLLLGSGAIPSQGAVPDTTAAQNISFGKGWYTNDTIAWPCIKVAPDVGGSGDVSFSCDRIDFHLQENSPAMGFPYPNPINDPRPANSTVRDNVTTFFGWRGPYFDGVSADPWGNRYMINTFALYAAARERSRLRCSATRPEPTNVWIHRSTSPRAPATS